MSIPKGSPGRATVRNQAGSSTRKVQMSRVAAALSAFLAVALIVILFTQNVKSIGTYGPIAVLAGFGLVYVAIKQLERYSLDKAKRSKDAERGAEAEEAVGEILDSLPDGFFIIHDFDSGKGNIDHIIIGPKGIFTIETKSQRGEVTFDGNQLLLNGRPFRKDFLNQAWAECFLVREILNRWEISEPKAEPVILFANAFVKVRGKARGVEIVSLKYLPKYLEGMPDMINKAEAGRIYNRVKATMK